MPEKSQTLNIPPEAIMTMRKDLAGITQGDWSLTVSENEIEELLRRLEEKRRAKEATEIIKKRQAEEKALAQKKKEEEEKKKKEEKEETQKEEQIRLKKEEKNVLMPKKEPEEKKSVRLLDEERQITEEIRKRARQREKMVKKEMGEESDKSSLQEEEQLTEAKEEQDEKTLRLRKAELLKSLKDIPKQRTPLDESKDYYLRQKAKIEKDLEPILEGEKKIEDNVKFIEGVEKTAITPMQKRKAERERQLAEQERETIEKQRWEHEQKKFQTEKQLKEIEFGYQQIAQQEAKIKQAIEDVNKELEKIAKRKDRQKIEEEIERLTKDKQKLAKEKEKILARRKEIEEKLAEIITREAKTEKEESYTEEEEGLSEGTEKERIEKERWKMEKIRSEIEKERWKIEEEKRKIRLEENRVNVSYEKALDRENKLREQIQEIDEFLGLVPPEAKKKMQEPEEKDKAGKEAKEESQNEEEKTENKKEGEINNPLSAENIRKRFGLGSNLGLRKKKFPEEDKQEEGEAPDKTEARINQASTSAPAGEQQKNNKENSGEDKNQKQDEVQKAKEKLEEIETKQRKEALLKRLRQTREQEEENKEKELLQRIRNGAEPSQPSSPTSPSLGHGTQNSFQQNQSQGQGIDFQKSKGQGLPPKKPLMALSPEYLNKKPAWVKWAIITGIISIIALIVGFWYWYSNVRNKPEPSPTNNVPASNNTPAPANPTTTPTTSPTTTPATTPATTTAPTSTPPTAPESLIPTNLTDSTIPLNVANKQSLLPALTQIFQNKNLTKDKFTRILIKDTTANQYIGLSDFLSALLFDAAKEFSATMEEEASFYVFPTKDYNSIGFIAKKRTNLQDMQEAQLKLWEPYIEDRMRALSSSLDEKNIASSASFKEGKYKGHSLHYLTLVSAPNCYGACYSVFDNEVVFASCCAPIMKLIDQGNL